VSVAVLLLLAAAPGVAAPPVLDGIGVDERPGAPVPRDVRLVDATGRPTTLGECLDGRRPAILVLGYWSCPMLCGLVQDGLARAVAAGGPAPGDAVTILTVSIDPRDGPEDSARRRRAVLGAVGLDPPQDAWSFLVGDAREVRRLADAVGFRYRRDPRSGQYAHPAVVVVLTPEGRVGRYVYGFAPDPAELREAVEAAGAGRTGGTLERVLLQCFRFTPALRRHAGSISALLKLGGVGILAGAGAVVLASVRWRRREAP